MALYQMPPFSQALTAMLKGRTSSSTFTSSSNAITFPHYSAFSQALMTALAQKRSSNIYFELASRNKSKALSHCLPISQALIVVLKLFFLLVLLLKKKKIVVLKLIKFSFIDIINIYCNTASDFNHDMLFLHALSIVLKLIRFG